MLNNIYKLFSIVIILVITSVINYTFAASVKIVKQEAFSTKSLPSDSEPIIYFDENKQLQFGYDKAGSSYYLANACNSTLRIDGSPSHQIIAREPKVDMQRCLPHAPFPYNVDYLFGLKDDNTIQWKHQLTVPLNAKYGDYRTVIGSSKDGIILHSVNTGSIEILNPLNGEIIYPTKNQTSVISKEMGSAVYDPTSQILYKTDNDYADNKPSLLQKINLKTGQTTELEKLPAQFFTKVPGNAYSMELTTDKRFIIIIAHISSRINPHDIFLIYDLKDKKWIYKKDIDSPFPGATIITTDANNIGILSNNGRGKFTLKQLMIIPDNETPNSSEN